MIAHLGTGLMGAGFVRAALDRGEKVHVWNRSFEKAHALEADGAKAFRSAADAVRGADRIHLTLSDDASVDEVLASVESAIDPKALILDHTTTAPTPTEERYAYWASRGIFFAHVPMFMGPQNAREHTGLMLISGSPEREARVRPSVELMTGKLINVGSGNGRAAAFKLFGNMMLIFITSGLADMYRLADGMGIARNDAHALFNDFKPGGAIDFRGKKMAERIYAPAAFELSMARKDVRLMLEEGALHGVSYGVLPQVAAAFDQAIAAGHGSEDMGALSEA
jgi:3-hydroxyisobutyrate dehydrogenase